MEHIAVARDLWHHRFLASPQPATASSNRVVWVKSLLHHIQQMVTPGVFVSALDSFEQIAVCGCRIDADQHWLICMENLVSYKVGTRGTISIIIELDLNSWET